MISIWNRKVQALEMSHPSVNKRVTGMAHSQQIHRLKALFLYSLPKQQIVTNNFRIYEHLYHNTLTIPLTTHTYHYVAFIFFYQITLHPP